MEDNLADALKIAAFVLIFVVALSISISSFSNARIAIQTVLEYKDREYDYSYVEENKDATGNSTTKRIVSGEIIIPTIHRAYNENYKIYFLDKNNNKISLYSKINSNGISETINYIDLEREVLGGEEQKKNFIKGILYGKKVLDLNIQKVFQLNSKITFTDEGLYDIIKGNGRFYEYLGEYYQEDLKTQNGSTVNSNVPETNKTKKRVVTYKQVN